MIEKLKMVNWKSHELSEITFSPATNLLIGAMGAGKTSCLDAICFAFFGTFPSLKSRQVKLTDIIMAQPEKKASSLVEVTFTSNKRYTVTRSINAKGTEAFLRCESALIEGPQPLRTTEAITRLLKIDYDTFTRVIYGEQNKIDYFLTLPKGNRKSQIDELIGISLFETVRVNCNSLISKLRTEKKTLETFLAGVNVENLEEELSELKKALQTSLEKKNSLESLSFSLSNELEISKKNLEALEQMKKINEEMSIELVKTRTEADSLHSSAVSIMPLTMSTLTREQCTSLLEQCARTIQEMADLENRINELSSSIQRLEGEALVVRQIIEQFPIETLKSEINKLTIIDKQLALASSEYLELTKKEGSLKSTSNSLKLERETIEKEMRELFLKLQILTSFENEFTSIQQLEITVKKTRDSLLFYEKSKSSKEGAISSLEKSLELLQREAHVCPTCDQQLSEDAHKNLIVQKTAIAEKEKAELRETEKKIVELSKTFDSRYSTFSKWTALLPLESTLKDLKQKQENLLKTLEKTNEELYACTVLVSAAEEKTSKLKKAAEKLELLKERLEQAERAAEKLQQIEKELNLLKEQIAKKKVALSTFGEKKAIEEKLNEARSALKAFDLFEKTESLKKKSIELKEKLLNLQFSVSDLKTLGEKTASLASKLESAKVSFEHFNGNVKEKNSLISKLENQFSKFSVVKKSCLDLENSANELTLFQNSVVETQTELRNELITAVNEAMHEVWQSVYPYRDYSSCKITPTDDDYLLEVKNNGGWVPIEQCSGGEKTCVALALRVSLAMVLVPNLSWLVLDEPTHNLDSQGVSLLTRALHDTLPSIVKQTFVVTHDEALKEGASGSVHVFQRDKDNGAATVVETLS